MKLFYEADYFSKFVGTAHIFNRTLNMTSPS